MNLLVRNNTWAGPWAGWSKPRAGASNCWAGPCRARVSWASLPRDRPGRADMFEKMMGRAAADPLKILAGRAGQRPIIPNVGEPGRAGRHGPAQPRAGPPASAHD